jgi:hypothetical protein
MRMINRVKGTTVTRSITLLMGAAVLAAALSGSAFSQGAPQTLYKRNKKKRRDE